MNREKKAHLPWRCTLGISFILFKKKVPHMNAITKKIVLKYQAKAVQIKK